MKKLSIAAVVALSTASYCGLSQAADSTYAGLDAVYSNMGFKKGFGHNVISKKSAPGLNVFVGHMFCDHFGAELGVEFDKKMKRSSTINQGDLVAGNPVPAGYVYISYNSTIKQRHPYLGVVGKYNFFNNTSASLMLGGSLSHIEAKYVVSGTGIGSIINGQTKSFSKTKLIPIIRASIEHKLTDHFGIRALVTWKNTSSIKLIAKENSGSIIKPKNTFSLGLGASYYL